MSSHNAATLLLSEISQKGTIIEPRRTLTFPIPSSMSGWDRIRFGLAFSLTDLVDAEAELDDISSNLISNDNALSSKFWFGLSSSAAGVLPGTSGFSGETFVGFYPRKSDWTEGSMMQELGNLSDKLAGTNFSRSFFTGFVVGDDTFRKDSDQNKWWGILNNGNFSQYRSTNLTVIGYDVTVKNRGESNQAGDIHRIGYATFANDQSGMLPIPYSEFDKSNFVNVVQGADTHGENDLELHDAGVPANIPDNIVFHWPFFNRWRLRLHGAVLIHYA